MLKSLKRIVYQVEDLEKAKQWYSKILNTQPIFDTPNAVIFAIGICSLSLVKGKNTQAETSIGPDVYWEVDDIDSAFQTFIENGATPHTPVKSVFNIKVAKVIDPFGNSIGLTGVPNDANKKTIEEEPSESAMTVAFCRALAFKDDRKEIKGPDNLAELFLKEEAKKLLADPNSRKWAIQNLVTSPLYGYFISRTAFIDSVFENAIKENIQQVVFLGAGYDTRSYRFAELIKDTKIFELDAAPTQKRKLEILGNAGVKIHPCISFVKINFKTDNLVKVLADAGYENSKPTLFIWEGVLYYLTKQAGDAILNFIKTNSPSGSSVCFDYLNEQLESINPAEPFRFWIRTDDLEPWLSKHGFKINSHMNSSEMEKKYLTLTDGVLAEKSLSRFCLVHAQVS